MNKNDHKPDAALLTRAHVAELRAEYFECCEALKKDEEASDKMGPMDFAFVCGKMNVLERVLKHVGRLDESEIYKG